MTQRSLRGRLFLIGFATIALALLLAGGGLVLLFEHHVERTLDDDLDAFVHQIQERLENDASTGELRLSRYASDPRFDKPTSGYYWQVSGGTGYGTLRSKSLQDSTLVPHSECIDDGRTRYWHLVGPAGETLFAGQMCVKWRGLRGATQVLILAGIDVASLETARNAFAGEMILALLMLASLLAIALWFHIDLGIAPLAQLRAEVSEISRGERTRLGMVAPKEIQPVVDEMNALLDERAAETERARNHAADLAHGLKTPLTALVADSRLLRDKGEIEIAGSLERIAEIMQRTVARELVRARAKEGLRGRRIVAASVSEVVDTLVRTLTRTGTGVEFDVRVPATLTAAIGRDDLMEIIGNLLENASRYASSLVRVSATKAEGSIHIVIEDDGPGLPEGAEQVIRRRGGRLDESGSAGLGLAIVQDVLDAYGATIDFSHSDLGGLRVSITLSARDESSGGGSRAALGTSPETPKT
jgi:signal transduction histidine kinase